MKTYTRETGLTLIELLVVIALVGMVAAISLPILLGTVSKADAKATDQSAQNVTDFKSHWETAGNLTAYDASLKALVAYEDINKNGTYEAGLDDVLALIALSAPSAPVPTPTPTPTPAPAPISQAAYQAFVQQSHDTGGNYYAVAFEQDGTEIVGFSERSPYGFDAGDSVLFRMTGNAEDANFFNAYRAVYAGQLESWPASAWGIPGSSPIKTVDRSTSANGRTGVLYHH